MTPVWILAARKLAVPIICTAAASVVYDRFSLPAEVPAEGPAGNTSQRKILRENVRGLCSVIVPGIECNCPALHSMPGQHAGYSDTSNNCIINLCSIRDVIVFFFFFLYHLQLVAINGSWLQGEGFTTGSDGNEHGAARSLQVAKAHNGAGFVRHFTARSIFPGLFTHASFFGSKRCTSGCVASHIVPSNWYTDGST